MTFDLDTALQNPDLAALNPELVGQASKREKVLRKYRNNPTEYKGRIYASMKEAQRAAELDLLLKAGEIVAWFPQVRFELQAGIHYVADFVVIGKGWSVTVEDVKSEPTKTREYRMKRKLFREKFGREITER